jgi:hypothetical protein
MAENFIVLKNVCDESFSVLSQSTEFENITIGRSGANIFKPKSSGLIPIMRTSTLYLNPSSIFLPIHYNIIANIVEKSKIPNIEFNTGLIEIYDEKYKTMKFHSDQALDLCNDSYICIFSCYESNSDLRTLKIKNKSTNDSFDIKMDDNSAILFSTETNKKYMHKIVLENSNSNNKWLGITFRLAKTFIYFKNEIPYFSKNNIELRLASKFERSNFYKQKEIENSSTIVETDIDIPYTLSIGDTLLPKSLSQGQSL